MSFLLELKEGLWIAWDSIRSNKLRACLTMLGIIIGIVSVTLMGAAIDGLNRAFRDSISIMGADVLYVDKVEWFNDSDADWRKAMNRRDITMNQVKMVQEELTLASAVAPWVGTSTSVRYGNHAAGGVDLYGTTDQYLETEGLSLDDGRFLTSVDSEGGRPVCVLGNDVATNLFPRESPLGKKIRVGGRWMDVVGVLHKRGSFMGLASMDNYVIIPLRQLLTSYWRNPSFSISVKAVDLASVPAAKEELRSVLRKARHVAPGAPDDFAVNQQEQAIKLFHRLAGTIAAAGLAVTSLALFVGGIGIMNIMYVSVAERTREIGVRKAIGAKKRAILTQFLIEAACICLLGGLAGVAVVYGIVLVVSNFFPASLSLPVVGLAVGVSLLTGVVSGFLPAWRAARLDPVEALRNE